MFNTNGGYSLSDIAAVSGNCGGNNGGWGDGSAWWIIILFLFVFCGWGNNGWGNGGVGGATGLTADIGYNFDISDVSSGIRDLASSTASGFYGLNTSLLNGFSGMQNQLCNTGFETIQAINANGLTTLQSANALQAQLAANAADAQMCCCQTQGKIDSNFAALNYNLATEACADRAAITTGVRDIIDNQNAGTRQILDFLVQDRITALTTENAALRGQISQSEQNAYLISALRPTAEPAYVVANPYTGTGYGYGYHSTYNTGCGCGCYTG